MKIVGTTIESKATASKGERKPMKKNLETSGYGAEFDVEFMGGPFDGLKDIVINLNALAPPTYTYRKMGENIEEDGKAKLGIKLIEQWKEPHTPNETRVAIYKLRRDIEDCIRDDDENDDEYCLYDFLEISNFRKYRKLTLQK